MVSQTCQECGKSPVEKEGNNRWVKGGTEFDVTKNKLIRCGHCGCEQADIDPHSEYPLKQSADGQASRGAGIPQPDVPVIR
jgi:hypothetical protein